MKNYKVKNLLFIFAAFIFLLKLDMAEGMDIKVSTILKNLPYSSLVEDVSRNPYGTGIVWREGSGTKDDTFRLLVIDKNGKPLNGKGSILPYNGEDPKVVWNGNGYGVVWFNGDSNKTEMYFTRTNIKGEQKYTKKFIFNTSQIDNPIYEIKLVWADSGYGVFIYDGKRLCYIFLDQNGNLNIGPKEIFYDFTYEYTIVWNKKKMEYALMFNIGYNDIDTNDYDSYNYPLYFTRISLGGDLKMQPKIIASFPNKYCYDPAIVLLDDKYRCFWTVSYWGYDWECVSVGYCLPPIELFQYHIYTTDLDFNGNNLMRSAKLLVFQPKYHISYIQAVKVSDQEIGLLWKEARTNLGLLGKDAEIKTLIGFDTDIKEAISGQGEKNLPILTYHQNGGYQLIWYDKEKDNIEFAMIKF